jgi:hypothetical protein
MTNRFAKYSRRKPGERNKLEASYEAHLELLKKAGKIWDYKFEGMKLRLANNTWFTPDFVVFSAEGAVELHDTKGTKNKKLKGGCIKAPWCEADAKLKMKVIADLWPFKMLVIFKTPDGWQQQEIS